MGSHFERVKRGTKWHFLKKASEKQNRRSLANTKVFGGFYLVGMTGFEPAASTSRMQQKTLKFQWFWLWVATQVATPSIFRFKRLFLNGR